MRPAHTVSSFQSRWCLDFFCVSVKHFIHARWLLEVVVFSVDFFFFVCFDTHTFFLFFFFCATNVVNPVVAEQER